MRKAAIHTYPTVIIIDNKGITKEIFHYTNGVEELSNIQNLILNTIDKK